MTRPFVHFHRANLCGGVGAGRWERTYGQFLGGGLCVFTESLNKDKSRSFLANQARQEVQFSK